MNSTNSKPKKRNYRKISFKTKLIAVFSVSLLIFALISGYFSYKIYYDNAIEQNKKISLATSELVALNIDPDHIQQYIERGERDAEYLRVLFNLSKIKDAIDNVKYIYVYKILPDGCHVVFDLDTETLEGEESGTVIPFDESFKKYIPTLLKGEKIEPLITDDTYGWLLTAYTPIYDAVGKCQAYAAVDISMDWLKVEVNEYLTKIIAIFFIVFLILLLVVIIISKYNFIIPINSMTDATSDFVYNDTSSMEKSLEYIKNINIHTGDEIENLYMSFTKMASDSVKYIEDINHKNEAITKMHNALITTLADMVEKRDKNTGEHIRKTAAYTKIIMDQLRINSEYKKEITDTFYNNVINSAPLHDIGKINVPDAILNKPGKLTDDEFTLMKSHTTTGGTIISHLIEVVPESSYLTEAQNLATYHHEKWNGRGYPSGLAGTDIPLSARIMAVADVFDALVSKRSYKEGMPYEKAFAIIMEERGSHFDPIIVDAFFAAKEKVLEVADKFNSAFNTPF
ncbi:MAG: HD domain-containing protein [Desulfovibrio sp.]|nr:HD domain-containing protein [Desulfovibrio sp.]